MSYPVFLTERHFISNLANRTIGLTLLLFSTAAFAAESPTAEDPEVLLQRIRSKMATHLAHLPNYTCHEVIDRLVRCTNSGTFEHLDRVELEVAFLGKRELFSRPGEDRFKEQEIHNLVPVGTIGNGVFGAHVDTIFTGHAAEFKYIGPVKKDGHKAFRYDFRVPQENSHFLVRRGSAEGIVGYKGSFWVDTETLDLVWVEIKVDRIPSHIGVSMVEELMQYKLMRIRNSDFLLPRNSQLTTSDKSGNYSLNIISLERCREFTGESAVTYGAPADDVSADREVSQH